MERLRERSHSAVALATHARSFRVAIRAGVSTLEVGDQAHPDGGDLLVRASTALRYASARRVDGTPSFDEVPATFV